MERERGEIKLGRERERAKTPKRPCKFGVRGEIVLFLFLFVFAFDGGGGGLGKQIILQKRKRWWQRGISGT